MTGFNLPFFNQLTDAKRVLIAGAGGGFDVFSGLPLYFHLRAAGKTVFLASLSFSDLAGPSAGRVVAPSLVEVTADSEGSLNYFPEKYLSEWFRSGGHEVPVYSFHRTGPRPIIDAYRVLRDELDVDTVIAVDGGTDSLMRGDESGLGTPEEDMTTLAAVRALDPTRVPRKFLACLGFGIDTFHGVCHAHVLEAVADLTRAGGYLGAFSLLPDMPQVRLFADACRYVIDRTPAAPSIVLTSILSAIEGRFGNHHSTDRTTGSELFINPLMGLYWCFALDAVADRVMYLDRVGEFEQFYQLDAFIGRFRSTCPTRPWRDLPM